MWYYITTYSFDAHKQANGPFNNKEEAWIAMLNDAQEEYRIDKEENKYLTQLIKNKDYGEITLLNLFTHGTNVTKFLLFEI
jgi:hypothetical protein